jgi:lipopolysaccharide/colanic/teichoic acid biosynthesis glycosyltransferase
LQFDFPKDVLMLADPLRGRFAGLTTHGLIMPTLAAASIQITGHHPAGLLNKQTFLPAVPTAASFFWLIMFLIASQLLFSYSFLHRCRTRSRSMLLFVLLGSCAAATYLLAFYLVMLHREVHYGFVLATFFAMAFVSQALIYKHRSSYFLKHRETVMILGTGREAQKMWKHIRIQCNRLVLFNGFIGEGSTNNAAPDIRARTVCTIESLECYLQNNVVDTLILTANGPTDLSFAKEAIRIAQRCGIRLLCANEAYEDLSLDAPKQSTSESYVDFDRPSIAQSLSRMIKTASDRLLAATALACIVPLALPLLLVYRFIIGDFPLVSESTYGYHRHRFSMWNLRTKCNNGKSLLMTSDRVPFALKIGRFLELSGLSHTPRLWNVCMGDMSLVGPPPIPLTDISHNLRRYTMRPGLCSPEPDVQNPSNSSNSEDESTTLSYLQHWNLVLDWRTLRHWLILQGRRTRNALPASFLTSPSPIAASSPRSR